MIDEIRDALIKACSIGIKPRLTIAGLVSRLIAQPYFRNCGFTPTLFRQALFTQLMEANIAPTRLTQESLDRPLEVTLEKGKRVWPDRFWRLLNVFGSYLESAPLDDPEVESFEEDAVLMLTFHQAKGLQFDHVYVAGTGREPDLGPALRTKLFSGEVPKYRVDGTLTTQEKTITKLALADRDREVYVAMTRAKKELTILHDQNAGSSYMKLNPAITSLFKDARQKPHPLVEGVMVKEYSFNG
jgi:UvrD-like helicase C-terminal domain